MSFSAGGNWRRLLLREVFGLALTAGTVWLVMFLYFRSVTRRDNVVMSGPLVAVGAQVKLDPSFGHSSMRFVLVSSQDCGYCRQSAPFHRKLGIAAADKGLDLYIAVPDRQKARAYLRDLKVRDAMVKEWNDLGLRVPATPTLLVTDEKGVVKRLWVGLVPKDVEEEILAIVNDPTRLDAARSGTKESSPNYSHQELRALERQHRVVGLIDIREREDGEPRFGARRIPLPELMVRAPYELEPENLVVIDCGPVQRFQCEAAVTFLSVRGFRTATLDAGTYYAGCRTNPTGAH